ncbi:MAG: YkgJ family cysteine cluster protein [Desulfobulbaceae bacterium]|jgi:Fe-S-cluster containining protein|nr:YkgJ family cysteine cluster protein [Desulfobulbaceae bacterium]MDY0352197.1 YkgJ family cysteine cluster protein [Desulfobulbaceae bacterium]
MNYCNYCPGYCCYRLEGSMLLLTAVDINRLARHFGISDGEVRNLYLENKYTFKVREDGSCVFLARDRMSRRCTIHEARPDQCRRFPYGKPCPYLERKDLLERIQPRVEKTFTVEQGRSGPRIPGIGIPGT